MIDFNTEPYNDDYDENKKFYRILFRPSFAVQARELTQLQTILQKQISRHGDAIFKQGAMVIPGQASVETVQSAGRGADYVKLTPIYSSVAVETFINNIEGQKIIGSSGVTAELVKVQNSEQTDPTTIYVRYTNSGTDGVTKTFSNAEVITTEDGTYSFQALGSDAIGKGSIATIQQGVYYINGHFCLVDAQTIVLDKYSNTPSYRVGLDASELVITPEEDETLLDNAQNSYNFAAPGAHRYSIALTLMKLAIDSEEDQDFVELIRVNEGYVKTIVDTTEYSFLATELARRTYDESGDYTVRPFELDVREHRNNDRGAWAEDTEYLIGDVVTSGGNTYVATNGGSSVSIAPVHTSGTGFDGPGATGIKWRFDPAPFYNRGIYLNGDETKLAIGLEPGKAYVRGFELEKDSTTFLPIDKARDFAQASAAIIPAAVGNYVLVTNVNNAPPIDILDVVTLYDRPTGSAGRGEVPSGANIVGYARVRFMEWNDTLPFGYSSIYKLGLFDIQLNNGYDFNSDVKSFVYTIPGDADLNFTADISPVKLDQNILRGSVTASGTTVTGAGTSFTSQLNSGDHIVVNGALYRVDSITDQDTLTLSSSLTATNAVFYLARTEVYEPENNSLVFQLPYYAVRSMRQAGTGGINDTTFYCYQKFTQDATGTSLVISTSGTFASSSETDNFICIDNASSGTGGEIFTPVSISISGSNATITVPSAQSGHSITVIAAVIRNGSGYEKTKTLETATPLVFSTAATAQETTLLLEHADIYRLLSVKMAPAKAFGASTTSADFTQDISDRYEFDNGQRDTHYDLGRLVLRQSFTAPSNPIQVEYEYFDHGVGDYFDVNSYNDIDYKDIPANLRDAIDFRPRMANKSGGSTRNFVGTGASITATPKRGLDIEADFSYYLPRKDKIALDSKGTFFSVTGVPALNPGYPEDPSLGMVLYNLEYEPYTFGTESSNVKVTKIENKRYTMRDIGKLEKRIDNLEYYTSLSLLETETQSLKITDADGFDRLKNGFIVDNFTGNNIADAASEDYFCSIDRSAQELRPFYTMNNINLLEKNSNTSQRTASKYKLHGDVITLPVLSEPVLIKQDYASRLENINPFAIFTFLGNLTVNPPSDDWFETKRLPDIIQQSEGNYNVMLAALENTGVLGTVWNAWQDEWIGKPTTETTSYSTSGRNWVATYRRETTTTPIGQSRTGLRTSLAPKIDYTTLSDRTVSSAVIPYIRSRNLLVQSKSLKPDTRFYAYFEDTDISAYVTPATKIVYTLSSGSFDYSNNVGGSSSETKRRIEGDSQICLNRGDVITNSANTASAVVVGKSVDPDTGALTLEVLNVIGTFSTGQGITGSPSGAIGTVVSVTTPTTLTTNKNGDLNFLFNIPNTDSVRFRTGTREIKLIDSATSTGQWTSRGRAQYRAEGILETKEKTINAVRNSELVKEVIGPNDDPAARQTIFPQTIRDTLTAYSWWDPLAQSFLVENKGGAFLTKIDIFFATKDERIPVSLEIREMVNGYPGKNILPFSKVTLKPEQVNLSSTSVNLDGTDYPTFDTPTTFTFEAPVYVQEQGEYCFVLSSDSNKYKCWISQMGDVIPGSSRTISEQPYNGVLFKSQNASTWTADQYQDIKFTIYRAQFNTAVTGNVEFVNDVLPYETIEVDPFQTVTGSKVVRVWHYDHGMTSGSRVDIKGVTAAVNGIPAAEINGEHVISNVDLNCYTITVDTTNATISGYGGGSEVKATKNCQFDIINPSIQLQTFSDTEVSFGLKTTSGKSIDGSETPYIAETTFAPCLVKENNFFKSPRVVASEVNENNSALAGNKSFTFNVLMSSTNDSLSPVIDTARASIIAISNKVNSPTQDNTNVAALDIKTIFTGATGAFTFTSGGTITSTNGTLTTGVRAAMRSIGVGKYVTITGATTSGNNKTVLVTGYTDDGTTGTLTFSTTFTGESAVTGTTIQLRELFVDEIAPLGSSTVSKYVTSPIKLAQDSTNLRIRFGANIPNEAEVLVYYKTCKGDSSQLKSTKYTLATPDASIVKVENGNETFYDVDYTIENMDAFDTVTVKLALRSTNSSAVPRVRDLRVIALA